MAKFVYNNAKNVTIGHIFFELNYSYYLQIFIEKDTKSNSYSKTANKLTEMLKKLLVI